ncbi:MAG: signal peptidase I [Tenericutes bacterium]|nr:signal peptidase I [Mycoplasmatota bacterium]
MNNSYIRLLMLSILFFVIIIFNCVFNFFNSITFIIFLLSFAILSYYFVGFEKNKKRYQKDIIISIITFALIYYLITYILGIYVGFNRTGYIMQLVPIIKNILPVIIIIILGELIRYIFITKGSVYKSIIILTIINLILLDITLLIHSYSYGPFLFVFRIIVPSIGKNLFLTYATYKVGYNTTITYRILFELPHYLLPIFPTFGNYLDSLLEFLVPFLFIYIIYKKFDNISNKKVKVENKHKFIKIIIYTTSSVFLIIVIALTSGLFKYYVVTIGSNSMHPIIDVGDVVIVEKLNKEELNLLEVGDLLVFKHDNLVIIHRIVNILKVNEEKYYYTKGDNNKTQDGYPIKETDVIGRTIFKIKYIGYPTVEINKLIERKI